LKNEILDLKDLLKSRTEQANESIKKMAKINLSLKSDLDNIKKVNDNLEADIDYTKNQ